MVGSKFFGMGCAASFILGNNLDYAQQLAAWKAQGKLGSPPRLVSPWEQPADLSCIFCDTVIVRQQRTTSETSMSIVEKMQRISRMPFVLHADTSGLGFILTAGIGGVVYCTCSVSNDSSACSPYLAFPAELIYPLCPCQVFFLFAGNVQYNIASTCSFAHNFPQQYEKWSANTVRWLITVMYTSGGAFYLLAGLFYVLTDTGPKFWKGKPSRRRLSALILALDITRCNTRCDACS